MLNKLNIDESKKLLIVYIVLTVVTLAVFWQANQFPFVNYDDPLYITKNFHIQKAISLEGFKWAFSTRYADLWNPLVWLSFMLDYNLFGLNAGGYHVTNLILHILNTLLLFWLLNRMTGSVWKSTFVAAFFALHPLHVESVAWVSERKDVLSAFFWMLTLCIYVYYTEKLTLKRYVLVLFSFALALLSKPMVITLPFIMVLLDYWPLKRFESQKDNLLLWQVKEKLPLVVLSIVIVIITINNPNHDAPHKILPLDIRMANAPVAFVTYIIKTFWPHNLAIFYPYPTHMPLWKIFGSSLLIILITTCVIFVMKHLPYFYVGWFWYAISIAPVMGFIQISAYSMADHYHYLPSIGIAIMLAWGIPLLFKNKMSCKDILLSIAIVFLVTMTLLSWRQCRYWENSLKIFRHSLQVTQNNTMMHNLIGYELSEKGNFVEAIYYFNRAIMIAPDYVYAYNNRANAYAKLGQYQRAIEDYNRAIFLYPDYAESYYARGNLYGKLMGKYELAINDFNKAIRLKPDYMHAYNNRGTVLNILGSYQMAIDDFNKAIRLKPSYANSWNNRAFSYFNIGDTKQGCSDAKEACKLGYCNTLRWAQKKGHCN